MGICKVYPPEVDSEFTPEKLPKPNPIGSMEKWYIYPIYHILPLKTTKRR